MDFVYSFNYNVPVNILTSSLGYTAISDMGYQVQNPEERKEQERVAKVKLEQVRILKEKEAEEKRARLVEKMTKSPQKPNDVSDPHQFLIKSPEKELAKPNVKMEVITGDRVNK